MNPQKHNSLKISGVICSLIFGLCLALALISFEQPAYAKYDGGAGTEADPYRIATAEHLNDIGINEEDWDKHFILVNDIDLAQYSGTQFNIIGKGDSYSDPDFEPFAGVFDGNGYRIWNFTWSSTNVNYIGLFRYLSPYGQIKNLGLENMNVSTTNGEYVGGLVAVNWGVISNCYSKGNVSGTSRVGGIVGFNWNNTIINCYSTVSILDCSELGGGLVGENEGTVINCYSTGRVSGVGPTIGGLAGGSISAVNSFWDVETSGQSVSGGGTGKTTAEMKLVSTYFGWGGCESEVVWTIDEGEDYPRLAWEGKPGQLMPRQQLSDFVAGTGTEIDPYLINTPEQLNVIGLFPCEWDWGKHFRLTADIDCSMYKDVQFNQIGVGYRWPFMGVFDGNGHTISNFTYHSNLADAGLFGNLTGVVRNLGLIDVDVSGAWNVGGLAGSMGGMVSNCYVTGRVSGQYIVGGMAGRPNGRFQNCYSMAETSGDTAIGGFVGLLDGGLIYNCYANGKVTGNAQIGGLVGKHAANGAVIASYWDFDTSSQILSGGGNGRTTAEMKLATTYFGWGGYSNEETWTIDEGNDYPRLAWEGKPGSYITGQLSDIVPGSGSEADPYLISTAEQLNAIGLFPSEWDKQYELTADIDLSDFKGVEFNRIGANIYWPFAGIFNGSRHKIKNFTYYTPHILEYEFVGLFCDISDSAVVRDLGVIDVNVAGYQAVGGLAGRNSGGTILNCCVTGIVLADYRAGGLIGWNQGSVITSWSSASIEYGHILGGLVGENNGLLSDCYATGAVLSTHDFSGSGGLVGDNGGEINNCYAVGPVAGPQSVIGGLVGIDLVGTVSASFWDIETSGQSLSAGGIGKTTAEMKTGSTFTDAGWDFMDETTNGIEDLWLISEGVDYPRLSWHIYAYAPNPPDGATSVEPNVVLSWMPSMTSELHDVYFGDNFEEVNDGTGDTFLSSQTETYFSFGLPNTPYPDGLIPGTTYYWRIDEHNTGGTIAKGEVWSFTVVGAVEETVEYQVSASEDDGYAYRDNSHALNTLSLRIGFSYYPLPYCSSAMVFRDLNIPRGAEIVEAHLKIQSYDRYLTETVYGRIQAEATDDAAAFSDSRNIASLSKTIASIDWDHYEPWLENTWYDSPDIAEVIQEVINRDGWTANNSLAIIYCTRRREGGSRMFSSYDRGSECAPKLEITYKSR